MRPVGGVVGLVMGVAVVAWAHVSMGGDLMSFAQPEALVVVFGGTLAALIVSFPAAALAGTCRSVLLLARRRPAPLNELVPAFTRYARVARREGFLAVERAIDDVADGFLKRALGLIVSGLPAPVVREALDLEARVAAEQDDERAQVLEAAAGYAPTLGIVGAVLGLMRAMQDVSAPDGIGAGIAAAFVSTVYGVGAANLLFLPIAMRLRTQARLEALRRDLMTDGVLALRDGASPGVVEERLAGYLRLDVDRDRASKGAA